MSIIIITVIGIGLVYSGRLVFGAWVNPVSLYTGLWSISLILFELRLIQYFDLETETWAIIIGAGMAYCIGCFCVVGARYAFLKPTMFDNVGNWSIQKIVSGDELRLLNMTLWILNIIGMIAVVQYWYVGMKLYGSLQNIFIFGNIIYSKRIAVGMPGTIPYIDATAMAGAVLAGAYTALTRRLRIVAILPILIIVLVDIVNMGRAKMFFGTILYFCSYVACKDTRKKAAVKNIRYSLNKIIPVIITAAILWGGAEFVRSTRITNETVPGATQALGKFSGSYFITPSIYLYLTVHPGVFNQFLIRDDEHTPWGSNTFAPAYHILSKFGFETPSSVYQRFYPTPAGANTGTYLRDLYADFGLPGLFLFPFILGIIATALWYRYLKTRYYVDLMMLAHILVIVLMSLFYMATRAGDWFVGLIIGLVVGSLVDKKIRRTRVVTGLTKA